MGSQTWFGFRSVHLYLNFVAMIHRFEKYLSWAYERYLLPPPMFTIVCNEILEPDGSKHLIIN